jgi:acyl transferase domain-containing protein
MRSTRESAADAILSHALKGVDFLKTIEAAHADGARIFLEDGPGGSCTRMINHILSDAPHTARSFCIQGQESLLADAAGAGAMHCGGHPRQHGKALYGGDSGAAP